MTMDRNLQANLGAGALLLLACLFAIYRWHYTPMVRASAGLATLSDMLKIEADHVAAARPLAGGTDGATVPELLGKIQEAATSHNVAVKSVTPNAADPQKIALGVGGDFRDMMAFMGRLETFQVAIDGFEFVPGENGLNGTVEIQHTGKPGAPASFADYLEALVSYSAVRNPFEIGDPVPLPNSGADLGDLSWTYHLTSISLYGAVRVATIDRKDYRAGDKMGALTITAIGPSSVSLTAPGQKLVQKIHFRRNPGEGRHAD
jgi:hypothetical protein